MTEPFFLSKAAAIEAARKAWNENRLGCQDPGEYACKYRYSSGRVCAIGAGIPDEIAYPNQDFRVSRLRSDGVLATDDVDFLFHLQNSHDNVCRAHRDDDGDSLAMARFCALIGVEPPSPPTP